MRIIADCKIWLYACRLNDRLDTLEKSITSIEDKMDILDTGAEALMSFWDSPACRQWNGELKERLKQIKDCTEKMGRLLLALNEIAKMLAEVEKQNGFLVDLVAGGG